MILSFRGPLFLTLAALTAVGCQDSESSSDEPVTAVATTTQVGDLARNVVGTRGDVVQILSPTSDPHDYEPRPSDAQALLSADLVMKSGGEVDEWFDQLVESSDTEAPVVSLIEDMSIPTGGEEEADPHWWQNPENAMTAVESIRDALVEVDPEGAETYDENAAAYLAQLEELDAAIARCVARVPEDQRKLVTSHDALGHYADRYDIEVIGAVIPSLSTQSQASAGETADLIDLIRSAGVTAIFPEAGVSQGLEEAVAGETGVRIGGELWADALGPDGSDGETYVEAMTSNTEELVDGLTDGALTCDLDSGPGGG